MPVLMALLTAVGVICGIVGAAILTEIVRREYGVWAPALARALVRLAGYLHPPRASEWRADIVHLQAEGETALWEASSHLSAAPGLTTPAIARTLGAGLPLRDRVTTIRYWQHIPAHEDEPPKLDLVICHRRGNELFGTIRRVEPSEQSHKNWTFRGYARGDLFFSSFFSKDPGDTSYGTLLLRRDSDCADRWNGFYNRLHVIHQGPVQREEFVQVAHYWSRSRSV